MPNSAGFKPETPIRQITRPLALLGMIRISSVPIASVNPYTDQQQIMFVRDIPQPNNEYTIIEAALDVRQLWPDALKAGAALITMATSFDEFLRRAIGNVLSGNFGFRYWKMKAAWVKYDGLREDVDEKTC